MRKLALLSVAALLAATLAGRAQPRPADTLAAANQAWDEGNYVAALEGFIALVTGADGERHLESIALTTGELYQTEELANDVRTTGRLSADGQRVAYEPIGTGPQTSRILSLNGQPARTIELPPGAVLDPSWTRAAMLRPSASKQPRDATIVIRDLDSGRETDCGGAGLLKTGVVWHPNGRTLFFIGQRADDAGRSDIYELSESGEPRRLTSDGGLKSALTVAASGAALAFVDRQQDTYAIRTVAPGAPTPAVMTVTSGRSRLDAPAFSPDGQTIAFQMMPDTDWEIYVVPAAGGEPRRLTREIQHDLFPRFIDNGRLLALMGEARHRRSHIYDLKTGARTRVFHNNTVRTVAPEYGWDVSRDGRKVLITADRDGDTISPQRGLYLVHLDRRITRDQLLARLRTNLASEQALRAQNTRLFQPIADRVRSAVGDVSTSRIYGYEKALFDFDSKNITQPGNRKAIDYLEATYRSFGYEPQLQWFANATALGGRTANVVATLRGTEDPDLVYVVSSHFDSVPIGPGADDDSSGTAALLEAARVLATRPQPATIVFASFTGEESGLLGSREWVRQASAAKMQVVGALNNDMIGMANDHRLDNTIRYSNDGIRDIQHGAAMLFTRLITYDSRYYQRTDAQAYYDVWGDIVGGIGSYPILGNPHYHQATDTLDTINHQLVAETSKTTVATLMLLASSPSRVKGLTATRGPDGTVNMTWTRSSESGVSGYVVAWGPASDPLRSRATVTDARATLKDVPPGASVSVKALNRRKLESWDWARVAVP